MLKLSAVTLAIATAMSAASFTGAAQAHDRDRDGYRHSDYRDGGKHRHHRHHSRGSGISIGLGDGYYDNGIWIGVGDSRYRRDRHYRD